MSKHGLYIICIYSDTCGQQIPVEIPHQILSSLQNIHRPNGVQSEPTNCMKCPTLHIVISKTVHNCNTVNNNILIHLYLKFFFRNIAQRFDVSTLSNCQGQVEIKLGNKFLTVEESANTLMEPQFMEVICIWAGLTGLAWGKRDSQVILASEYVC